MNADAIAKRGRGGGMHAHLERLPADAHEAVDGFAQKQQSLDLRIEDVARCCAVHSADFNVFWSDRKKDCFPGCERADRLRYHGAHVGLDDDL
jgi:hypothetical protein